MKIGPTFLHYPDRSYLSGPVIILLMIEHGIFPKDLASRKGYTLNYVRELCIFGAWNWLEVAAVWEGITGDEGIWSHMEEVRQCE